MNRATLRFLGFQHDRLAGDGGSQAERDQLLAKIDALAQGGDVETRVGERVLLRRRTRTTDRTFPVRVLSATPADGFVYVAWLAEDGRFGHVEHGKVEAYGDSLVACPGAHASLAGRKRSRYHL